MMAKRNEYVEYLLEQLRGFGPVRARAMFGGYGVYRDDVMFGLVSHDIFYLKVDDDSRRLFEEKGLKPFMFHKKGKYYPMSYYEAPGEALEDIEEMLLWAQRAFDAAVRARK